MGPLEEGKPTEQILKETTEYLEELIPSEKTKVGATIRRFAKEALPIMALPEMATLPMAARTGIGAVGGQVAEELGAPEWLQSIIEILPVISPEFGKKIIPTATQKPTIELLRKVGATEEGIAPLLTGEKKVKLFGKFAQKGEKAKEAVSQVKSATGRLYQFLRNSPSAEIVLGEGEAISLIEKLQNTLQDMPAKTRNVIMEDFQQFSASPKDGKSIIKFWQDINANAGRKPELSRLKKPLQNAMELISPQLSEDFKTTNELYKKYLNVRKRLSPKGIELVDKLINLSQWGRMMDL